MALNTVLHAYTLPPVPPRLFSSRYMPMQLCHREKLASASTKRSLTFYRYDVPGSQSAGQPVRYSDRP